MNPYNTLGVNKKDSPDEIKRAYYRLAKDKHPDVGGDEESFRPIADAYACLSDPESRAIYDETGAMSTGVSLEELIIREARLFLIMMIQDTLKSMVDHGVERQPGNFVDGMKKFVRDRMVENQAEQDKCDLADRLYADTLDKMFIKNPEDFEGDDVVVGSIRVLQEENDFNQFALANGLKVFVECITLLDLYGFTMPKQLPTPFTVSLGGMGFNLDTSG